MNKINSKPGNEGNSLPSLARQADNPGQYAFGRWNFNADSGDLDDGDSTIRLEPLVARLLAYLLSHQNRVISRDELMAAVWENRFVSDDAINRCVSILRHTLSPEDKNAYIETVVRKGYIAHFPAALVVEHSVAPAPRRQKLLVLAALACLAALAVYIVTGEPPDSTPVAREPQAQGPPMIAVLPFAFASQTGDSEFFANGVHDDLLTQLSKLQSMRVISSTSVKEYRNVARNMRKIGEELGADVILEGSVQIAADRIRINAQLIDAPTDEHLWAESYDRELTAANIFELQSEIAQAITHELNTTLTTQDSRQLAIIPTRNMAAYRAYHRALQLRDASGANLSRPEYLQALERAVELDPNFSRAWAELVSTLAFLNIRGDNPEMTLRAEQALQHLQDIAPGSADHLIGQAAYVYYALRDYDRAHDLVSLALAMQPSDVNAVQLRSWIERRQGDYDAALVSKYEARRLDPRNPALTDTLLMTLLATHRYDEAWAEKQLSPVQTFTTGYVKALQKYREGRDFAKLQESIQALCQYSEEPECGWDAHVANRDYQRAMDSLDQANDEAEVSDFDRRQIFTYWLMQDDRLLADKLTEWQGQLARDHGESGRYQFSTPYIGAAMLAGVQGNANQAASLIERWDRYTPVDWAERVATRHDACRVLGMVAATQAAVQCIRDGLAEPSMVIPFVEPYLPFYDPVREDPEFIEMLDAIDNGRPATQLH
jgi:TolB-like protein/DNA-binding winged helix-turn-helix (wHTH) protein